MSTPQRIVTVEAEWLEKLVERTEQLERRAVAAEAEAANLRSDGLMTLVQVRSFFAGMDHKTIQKLLADQPVVAYGSRIVLFRRSAIEALCKRLSVPYSALLASKNTAGKRRASQTITAR